MRRAHRVDRNQSELVTILEFYGGVVFDSSGAGKGFPDLTLGFRGHTILVEIKAPELKGKPIKQVYTPAQILFRSTWRGGPIVTIYDREDAIALMSALSQGAPPEILGRRVPKRSVKG